MLKESFELPHKSNSLRDPAIPTENPKIMVNTKIKSSVVTMPALVMANLNVGFSNILTGSVSADRNGITAPIEKISAKEETTVSSTMNAN
jgi:hypothetical protein